MIKFEKTIVCCLMFLAIGVNAQTIGLKTNLLMDATYNVNLGIEVPLAPHWTADVSGEYNNWTLSHGRRWKHWFVQPELRYWLCNRWAGHFLALHPFYGKFNIGGLWDETRYQGWGLGAGVAYGYAWVLNKHWTIEGEIGLGYAYGKYDRYRCTGCGKKIETDKTHHYVGPTKAAINLVYFF